MTPSTWKAEHALVILMTGGFFVHLVSLSRHLYLADPAPVSNVMFVSVDASLFGLMLWALAGMVFRFRAFFAVYRVDALWRKIVYWGLVGYIVISVPGHVSFLSTGDRAFFEQFPWWYSLAILPFFALVVLYVLTLQRRSTEK